MSAGGAATLSWLLAAVWLSAAAALGLLAALIALRAARAAFDGWRGRRRAAFASALDGLITGRPDAARGLHPRLWGDAGVVEEMLTQAALPLTGPLRADIARAAQDLGLVERRLRQLRAGPAHARAQAAERLGLLGSSSAVEPLKAALSDSNAEVRRAAVRALGRLRDPSALPALAALIGADREMPGEPVSQALLGYGEAAAPVLLGLARGPGRGRALRLLGRLRILAAAPLIAEALAHDPDAAVRADAARAAADLGHPDAAARLRSALSDESAAVRAQAARALGAVGDPESAPHLEAALDDSDWWTRAYAAQALTRLGEPGLEHLRRVAAGADGPPRRLAREMLDALGLPR